MIKLKSILNYILNEIILRPFGLRLSCRLGKDAIEDMKRLLSKVEVKHIMDGGAHRGDFSLSMLSAFPDATIYAFEPQSTSWNLLVKTASRNSRIKPFQYALGADSGSAKFYINQSTLTSSLLPSSHLGLKYFKEFNQPHGSETVRIVRLSDFLEKEAITHIDILKLDLQGYEIQALRGLSGRIDSVKLIYTEVLFVDIYENGCLFENLCDYLKQRRFNFYQLYNLVSSPLDGRLLFGDAIFINPDFIQV